MTTMETGSNGPRRGGRFAASLACAALVLAACGGDDTNEAAGGDRAGDVPADGAALDAGTVADCLAAAGFEVEREADQDAAFVLPDEYKESVDLTENLRVLGHGETKGIGTVGIYGTAEAAREANEDGASMRTDDVAAGAVGNAAWDYIVTAGDEGVVSAIEECLS